MPSYLANFENRVVTPKTMKLRIFLACRISKRLAREARSYRRALRDQLRKESAEIRKLEIRSRGLRLYAAWASGVSNVIQTRPEDSPEATLAEAVGISTHKPLLLNGRSHVL
jgi:hypothetical protein